MRSIIESIGGRAYKRYRIYERELDAADGLNARCRSPPSCWPPIAVATTRSLPPPGVAAKCLTPIAGTSDGHARRARAAKQSGRIDDILLCGPDARSVEGSPDLQALVRERRCPLDRAAGNALHQRRRGARRAPERDARARHDRGPRAARARDGAPLPGRRAVARRRRGRGPRAARPRAANVSANAAHGAQVQRRPLLRLQSLRVSHARAAARW